MLRRKEQTEAILATCAVDGVRGADGARGVDRPGGRAVAERVGLRRGS